MKPRANILVFTDLDGTFLDHDRYDYDAALPAVKRLLALGATILPVTSKTLAEIEALNLPFGSDAAIAENGMVLLQNGRVQTKSASYQDITGFIAELPAAMRSLIQGFHTMSIQDVVDYTGLSEAQAQRAKQRLASEPFLFAGNATILADLQNRADQAGLSLTRGGRFYHLMGRGDKAMAVQDFITAYRHDNPQASLVTIALGDGPNDAAMLACVDYGVKIPNPHGADFQISKPKGKIIKACAAGPEGWHDSLMSILDDCL